MTKTFPSALGRSLTAAALMMAATTAALPGLAADENNTVPGLTAAGAPLGLHGVDPVAMIKGADRVEGRADFTAVHDGVAYYFTSEANMKAFQQNPDRYEPENGGFCTYGVSVGKKFDGDPDYAAVVDGKLYVFLNEAIFKAYQKDSAGTIAKAKRQWAEIEHTAASDL